MSSTISSLQVATLGTPRIGPRRELKLALERFWSGASEEKALIEAAVGLRAANWARQKKLGVTVIPTNDFSFYDHVLDTAAMVGAIPEIYGWRRCRLQPILRWRAARKAKATTRLAATLITPTACRRWK